MKDKKSHYLANLCSLKMDLIKMVVELIGVQFWSEIIRVISNRSRAARSFNFAITHMIFDLIKKKKKLLNSDWLRTVQFFLNTVQERDN